MQRLITCLCICVAGCCLLAQSAFADVRVALVIGNGAYKNAPRLPNPPNDAIDVANALKQLGFDIILATDLDENGMHEAEIRFARAARYADVAMFYYSGHALQFGGVNYLMPIDAKLTDETDLKRTTRIDELVGDLQQAKNLRILVLDSCRDNLLAEELRRSIGTTRGLPLRHGLAKMDAQGMIVAYATQAGRTANDGPGRNSPYTTAFLKNIEAPDEIGTIFRRIGADVYEATNHSQLPELSLSLIGDFYLRGKLEVTVKADATPAQKDGSAGPPGQDPAAQAWAATQSTTSVAVLEDFLRQFGNTPYASLARARLQELRKTQVASASQQLVRKIESSDKYTISSARSSPNGQYIASASPGPSKPRLILIPPEKPDGPKVFYADMKTTPTTKILAIGTINPGFEQSQMFAVLPDEVRETVDLYLDGKIEQWYSLQGKPGVAFVINVTDPAVAHEMLEKLTVGKAHMMSFELIPLGPLNPLRFLQGMQPKS